MRKFNFLLVLLFALPILGIAQDDCENPDERRPICDPTFTRAEMTVHPIFDPNWEVTIDGKADEGFWSKIDPLDLPFDITDSWFTNGTIAAAPDADYEVSWKITYDEEFLYLFGEVTDDALVSRSQVTFNDSWVCDNIEVFTLFAGPDVIMPDWALGDASQLRIYVDLSETTGDTLETGGFAAGIIGTEKYQPQGYKTKTVKTDKGYDVEVRIPFGLISGSFDDDDNYVPIDVKALTEFQFDINGADRDDIAPEAQREYIWGWSATWNRNWGFTEGYGVLTVGSEIVFNDGSDCENPEERRPICDPTFTREENTVHPIFEGWEVTIDGKADEGFWSKIDPLDLPFDITDSWFTNGTIAAAPGADYEVSWKITYDEDFFYLFGEVTDDALVSRSQVTFNDSWVCDNIELFTLFAGPDVIMPDWALGDASQLRIYVDLNETTGDTLETGGFAAGIIGTEKYQPQGYKTKTVKTDKGYDVEVRIPFGLISGSFDDDDNYIPMDVKALTEFQFDINGADRDDIAPEAQREYIWGWSATWNRNWGFTEGYGVMTVGAPIEATAIHQASLNGIELYPNPAKDNLTVSNLEQVDNRIAIKNLLGQEVLHIRTSDSSVVIDISTLKSGLYVISVVSESKLVKTGKFIIQ